MAEAKLNEILNVYINLITRFITPQVVLLFGSQARGDANENSDIDVAIIVDSEVLDAMGMNFVQVEKELYRICEDVDWRIEPILIEDGDDPSGFLAHIKHYGKTFYKVAQKEYSKSEVKGTK